MIDPDPDAFDEQFEDVNEAKEAFVDELRSKQNVHGVGVGVKQIDGEQTQRLAIIVHVTDKQAKEELDQEDLIPSKVYLDDGTVIYTDVVEDEIPTQDDTYQRTEHDPFFGGVSGGIAGTGTYGTLGAGFTNESSAHVIITNRHVISSGSEDPTGTDVLQPSEGAGGTRVGDVIDYSPWDESGTNQSDSAIIGNLARPATNFLAGAGEFGSPRSASLMGRYVGVGANTGLTSAAVREVNYSGTMEINGMSLDFDGLIRLNRKLIGGDSGSVYVDFDLDTGVIHPVALHFAGSDSTGRSFAIPWGVIENMHGTLTPVNNTSYTEVVTDPAEYVAPLSQETNSHGGLEAIAARWGDPSNLQGGTVYCLDADDTSGTLPEIDSVTYNGSWGEPNQITFNGVFEYYGSGIHTVRLASDFDDYFEWAIQVLVPDELRVYGTVTDSSGNPIEETTVGAYTDSS